MSTLLFVVGFIVVVSLLVYLGALIINYDDNRKDQPQKTIDCFFTVIRWLLYIPIGLCSGLIFNILIAFMLSGQDSWFISGTVMQLVYKVVSLLTIGFCFYVIIPVLDKIKKIQSAAITLLVLETLLLFGFLLAGGEFSKNFVLDVLSTLLVFAGSVYVIVKPDVFE